MGCSRKTGLKIQNSTPLNVKLSISEIDDFDWDGVSRPDNNIHGKEISANGTLVQREEINANASCCMYRLTFTFSDGRTVSQRFDQKKALKDDYNHTQEHYAESERFIVNASTTSIDGFPECLLITISNEPLPTTRIDFYSGCYGIMSDLLEHTYIYTTSGKEPHNYHNFQCYGGVERDKYEIEAVGDLELAIAICCHNPYDLRENYKQKRRIFLSTYGDSSGILYGVTGVCHQMSNRILYACDEHPEVFDFTPSASISYVAYGIYGNSLFSEESNWLEYLAECKLMVDNGREAMHLTTQELRRKAVIAYSLQIRKEMEEYIASKNGFIQQALSLEFSHWDDEDKPNKRLELLINKAGGIDSAKKEKLFAANTEFHEERKTLLQGQFAKSTFRNLDDLRAFAEIVNPKHDKMLKEFSEILTETEFKNIFGIEYSEQFHLINMDNLSE